MTPEFTAYIPGFADLLALVALLVVVTAFIGLGRLIDRGGAPIDVLLVSGWGCAGLAATLFGVATTLGLVWILYPLLAGGFIVSLASLRRSWSQATTAGRMLVLALPTLLIVAAAAASQWDEFAHWLPNQRYLVDVGTFPRRGLPESTSGFAAYPYGLALVGFLVSSLVGRFVENAGAMFNASLIAVLALAVARSFAGGPRDAPLPWSHAALALLGASLLNPTFVPKLVFTTYADWPTAVLLGIAVWCAWRLVEEVDTRTGWVSSPALHLGFALATLVALKQPNVILAILLLAGIGLAALLKRDGSWRALTRTAAVVIGLPLLGYLAWRYHVLRHVPGREFGFMPLDHWLWSDLGAILGRMLLIASKKGGYFGLMLVASVVGGMAVFRALRGQGTSPLGRLAAIVAMLFLGYNSFLYLAYVGSFGAGEGTSAASFWRYNTQLGGAALIFAAVGLGEISRRYAMKPAVTKAAGTLAIVLVVAAPVVLASKLRFDMNPVTRYVREVGAEIAGLVPSGARLVVVDPNDNGKRAMLLRYETARQARVERPPGLIGTNDSATARFIVELGDAYVWIHVPTPALSSAVSVDLAPTTSHLLQHRADGWRLIRSWPYRGYTNPTVSDD